MSPRPFISFTNEPFAIYKFTFISILILLLALYMYMQLLNFVYAMTTASTRLSHCRYPLEVERSELWVWLECIGVVSECCCKEV